MPSSHYGRCAKVCWHSWSWPISLFLIAANGFVSNHVLLCGNWLDLDALLSPHCWSRPDERFVLSCFHASSDDDNRTPFQLSLVHAVFPKIIPSLNNNEWTLNRSAFLDKMSFVDGYRIAQMRKDSWDDSLPFNITTCLLRSFRCYAYSFAALHYFSQFRFSSSTTAPAGPVWRSLS